MSGPGPGAGIFCPTLVQAQTLAYLVLQVGERRFLPVDSDRLRLFPDAVDRQLIHRDVGRFYVGVQDGGSEGVLEEKGGRGRFGALGRPKAQRFAHRGLHYP